MKHVTTPTTYLLSSPRFKVVASGNSRRLILLALPLSRLGADLLVVLLERSEVLTSLGELTLLHTLTDVPVHKRTLGVHKVELVVDAREELSDGGGVGHHGNSTHHLGKIPTRHNSPC